MTTAPFHRVVCPGSSTDTGRLFIEIRYEDRNGGMELAISGVEGPTRSGNARGSAGQCRDALGRLDDLHQGWDLTMLTKLREVWDRWHLNRMRAGSPAQEAWLREHNDEFYSSGVPSHYDWARANLSEAGLHPDPETGYEYGSSWQAEDVPDDVLAFLLALPSSAYAYPWSK